MYVDSKNVNVESHVPGDNDGCVLDYFVCMHVLLLLWAGSLSLRRIIPHTKHSAWGC